MGAALQLLINAFEHIGSLEMFVVLLGQSVERKSLLNILFDPGAELGIFFLPSQQPRHQISAGFGGVTPAVKPV